jgi:hypothetical protein
MRSILRVAMSTVVLVGLAVSVPALDLQLQPVKESYRQGEPVVVRVLVLNPVSSTGTPYLKRHFWLVPFSEPMHGDLALQIEVTAPDGRVLTPTTSRMIVARIRTEPSMFQALYPGGIFGQEIALDGKGLEFAMSAPGIYRVSASLRAVSSREWFEEWQRKHRKGSAVEFTRDELFEGPLLARTIEIRIQ